MQSRSSPASAAEVRENEIQRAAIVGQLAGGIIHEFNNILTVITGTIEILSAAVADRPELAAIANLIDEAATRGAKLTTQLLAFARGQPSRPAAVDVNAVVAEASRLLCASLGVETEIASMLADDVPPALADPGQLTAAILSLAIAARNAMPDGGKLTFRTRPVRLEPSSAAAPDAAERNEAIVIAVHARGRDVAGKHPDRIFGDIAMAEDFVTRCGGRIKVAHQPGGALAEIMLPGA
jgi:signal transduction histidine kinase